MRIHTDNNDLYVNAIYTDGNGRDVSGHVYQVAIGGVPLADIRFQDGPVKENGVNGLTNEALLAIVAHRIGVLNDKFPCRENEVARTHVETALMWLEKQTADRLRRGVEGENKS